MLRRTSEYTLRFSPKRPTPDAASRALDIVLEGLTDLIPSDMVSGSGASGPTAFVQFRVRSDDEARRLARALGAKDFGTAALTTGHGVNYRHVSI